MKNSFKVIIIGGGPSGAMCGIELQKKGINTCIIEKSKFPRNKLCAGLLTQKSIDLLESHCENINQEDYVIDSSNKVDFYYEDKFNSSYKLDQKLYFTDRTLFDNILIEEYLKIGGKLIENNRVNIDDIDYNSQIINTKEGVLKYEILIGADGCNGILTTKDEITRYDMFCVEGDVPKKNDKITRIYFGPIKGGYGWYFPKKDHYSVGLGGDNKDKLIKSKANSFFSKITSKEVKNVRGAKIPSGRLFSLKKINKNCLIVGDSAGFTDPINGEGIYYALLSGIYAGETISENIFTNPNDIQSQYIKKIKHIRKNVKCGYRFKKFAFSPRILKRIMKHISKRNHFMHFYIEKIISSYQYDYTNLISSYLFKYKFSKRRKKEFLKRE